MSESRMAFAIKAEVTDPFAESFAFDAQKTMYGGKQIREGDTIFVFASENEGGVGSHREWRYHFCQGHPEEAGGRSANTPREHKGQTHRSGEASFGTERVEALLRVERRSTRDGAQLQVLSAGHEQDYRDFR